jgi:hypothetical protein
MSDAMPKRRLKISYGYHGNSFKKRPFIRLCGDYLSKMDFKIGDRIEISMQQDCILISKIPQEKNIA